MTWRACRGPGGQLTARTVAVTTTDSARTTPTSPCTMSSDITAAGTSPGLRSQPDATGRGTCSTPEASGERDDGPGARENGQAGSGQRPPTCHQHVGRPT